ncbi:MAG: hypothetical protein Q9190_007829, partial [Brigantiaea leucoxantha]
MSLTTLPAETLIQILYALPSIPTVFALTQTSRRLHALLSLPAHRLPILFSAASRQFSPLPPLFQLLTHNSSQPAHIPRPEPQQSQPLLKQILHIGSVANAWADIYPFIHWRDSDRAASRRFLSEDERMRVRRAVYRIWLYSAAFHNRSYVRTSRALATVVRERAALLRRWSSAELREVLDLQNTMRAILEDWICPSNRAVRRELRERFGENPLLPPPPPMFHPHKTNAHARYPTMVKNGKLLPTTTTGDGGGAGCWDEGWGDDISHYYVIEDMLKLDPGQILRLYHGALLDSDRSGSSHRIRVESLVSELGEWFENNGETMKETVAVVLGDRGEDCGDVGGGGGIVD